MLIDVSDDYFDIVRRNSGLVSQRTSLEQKILKNCLSLQYGLFGQNVKSVTANNYCRVASFKPHLTQWHLI